MKAESNRTEQLNHEKRSDGIASSFEFLSSLVMGVLLIITSLYLDQHKLITPLITHTLRDFGIAFLIAAYLAFFIERQHKKRIQEDVLRYMEEVGDNFIKAAYKKNLPTELLSITRESIFESDFIRLSTSIWIELNDLSDEYLKIIPEDIGVKLRPFVKYINDQKGKGCLEDLVAVRTALAFKMKNVSDQTKRFPIVLEIKVPFAGCDSDKEGIIPISSRVNQEEKNICSLSYHDIDPTKVVLDWGEVDVEPDDMIDVNILIQSVRRKRDMDIWSFNEPCHGIEIGVEDGNGSKDVFIEIMTFDAGNQSRNAKKNRLTNIAALKMQNFLLPYQGITIKWKPIDAVCPILGGGAR